MSSDYYKFLEVPKNASQDDIKKAYRKLAHQHHPDKQGGNEAKFKELNEAYQVLSDTKKRAQYDQFGSVPPGGFGGGGQGFDGFDFSQYGFGGQDFNVEDIFDLFGGAFGGQRRSEPKESGRGEDIQVNMRVSLHDVARGAKKTAELAKYISCSECGGSGAQKGSEVSNCSACGGNGQLKETTRSFFGNIVRTVTCKTCHGTGKVPKINCSNCKGEGRIHAKKTIEINIPAGINNGEAFVIRGEGQAGLRGMKAGDLYIEVSVEPDERFKRVSNNLVYELTIKVTDAILGADIMVPTLDGDKKLEIPAGTQSGDELRLKGLGIYGANKGDEIVKIKIKIPKKLSGKGKKLAEELAEEL
jgi:molecular chaperone DnaJ